MAVAHAPFWPAVCSAAGHHSSSPAIAARARCTPNSTAAAFRRMPGAAARICVSTAHSSAHSSLAQLRTGDGVEWPPSPRVRNGSARNSASKVEGVTLAQVGSELPKRVRRVKETKEVIMMDPVEAKRLAAVEMERLQAQIRLKKWQTIEAINGGWAVVGITAGIVIEGYSSQSIVDQVAGYVPAVTDFFARLSPP